MNKQLQHTFTSIYNTVGWHSKESISGLGSELIQTKELVKELPLLFSKYNIKSVLDIPCGDFNWMQHINKTGINYIGADIVEDLIIQNRTKHPTIDFRHLDITNSDLPQVDLILARDVFVHMTYDTIVSALENIIRSGAKYLLTTSFTGLSENTDMPADGGWRCINLLTPPFKFRPIYLINEDCTEGEDNKHNDKCLVLFDISRLYIGT